MNFADTNWLEALYITARPDDARRETVMAGRNGGRDPRLLWLAAGAAVAALAMRRPPARDLHAGPPPPTGLVINLRTRT